MKRKPKPRPMTLPDRYVPGFLAKLDGRTEIAQRLRANYVAIAEDLGGEPQLSHVKASLVERFVFLEAVLNKIENDLATDPLGTANQLGRWIQGLNSLNGL